MLRKVRIFFTFDAAVLVYKQTILPIIDYAGFLIIACRKDDKSDLQILQNDILRICNRSRILDRVSIEELHTKYKIISLEKRKRKPLLCICCLKMPVFYMSLEDYHGLWIRLCLRCLLG